MKKICISCGKEIVSGLFYQGDFVSLCEECGSEELAYADSIDSYVFEGDLKDCYSDDELSDIEKFNVEYRPTIEEVFPDDDGWTASNSHMLEEDDNFKIYSTVMCGGYYFEVYLDENGQSFTLAWENPSTGEVQEWNCGAYNDYRWDMRDIAVWLSNTGGIIENE